MLEALLAPGSELWMFNEVPDQEREKKLTDAGLNISKLVNIKLVHRQGNAVIRRHLESLPLETFDSVSCLVFSSSFWLMQHQNNYATFSILADLNSCRTVIGELYCSFRLSISCHASPYSGYTGTNPMYFLRNVDSIYSVVLSSIKSSIVMPSYSNS